MQTLTSVDYFPLGGLLPRPGPDGFGVLLGAFGGALLAEYMVDLLTIWATKLLLSCQYLALTRIFQVPSSVSCGCVHVP